MKKALYVLTLIAAIMGGCKSNSYQIEGTVQDAAQNGEYVYLKERINRVWTSIDSVKITDGKFIFSGECDSARVLYVFLENTQGEEIREPFVFENGNIKLNFDSTGLKITGTQQNDVLQQYIEAKKALYTDVEKIFSNYNDSTASEAQRQAFEQTMKANDVKITLNDFEFSTKYANTVVGNFIFGSTFYGMTVEQKEKIVRLMSPETKSNTRIAEIIAAIEIEKKTAIGQKFTNIELPDLTGTKLSLSSFVGKTDYVLIDFWASWCGPCMQSLPKLKSIYAKYGGKNLEIVGVSLDDDDNAWRTTIKSKELNWKHISDLQGWKSSGAALYAIRSIPATILIDKSGIVIGRNLSDSELEKILSTSIK